MGVNKQMKVKEANEGQSLNISSSKFNVDFSPYNAL